MHFKRTCDCVMYSRLPYPATFFIDRGHRCFHDNIWCSIVFLPIELNHFCNFSNNISLRCFVHFSVHIICEFTIHGWTLYQLLYLKPTKVLRPFYTSGFEVRDFKFRDGKNPCLHSFSKNAAHHRQLHYYFGDKKLL